MSGFGRWRLVGFALSHLGLTICSAAEQSEGSGTAVTFEIADVGAWVKPIDLDPDLTAASESGGISYLLLDRQENVEPRAYYRHESRKITSENGVQNGAAITASFDPSYQKLVFHFIRVTRNGVVRDRLERSRINLLRREPDMESFLYDGAYTAQCELEDVRTGDVIEFAYTIEGSNPVKAGRYSAVFSTTWSFPVERSVIRLLYPANRTINFLAINKPAEPTITTTNGTTEWLLEAVDVPARRLDPDTPPDHDPRGSIEFTEYNTWKQIVDWAIPLFATDTKISNDLQSEAERLRRIVDPEQRIVAALRFVQDEIRYLGIESGVGSHQPTAPSEVLRRRFGDCKDKVLLLATLLKQAGIEAAPALVSGSYNARVAEHLPAPEVFDHAILEVRSPTGTHWLDGTRSQQRGPLSQIYVREFGAALVLRAGVESFVPVVPPKESLPKKQIVDRYIIPPPGGAAELQITSEYHGLAADRIRSTIRENGAEALQKQYVQFYARRFPRVQTKQLLAYEELPDQNGCKVTESYMVPEIWQVDDEANKYEILLHPAELDTDMGSPGPSQRDDPLTLNHPVSTTQEITAEMFEPWPMNVKATEVTNSFFRFREDPESTGRRLRFTYSYESLTDRVSVADLPKYNAALSKVRDSLGYTISYSTPEQLGVIQRSGRFNWPIAAVLACAMVAAAFFAFRYYNASTLPEPLPASANAHSAPQGIGGWLLLVAFGMVGAPLALIRGLVELYPSIFHVETWRQLTDPGNPAYHVMWAPALLFALFFNSLSLVFACLLLFLFFNKRAAWPRAYAVYLATGVLGVLLDYYLTRQIPGTAEALPQSVREMVRSIIGAAIWIPYVLVSKRVAATFRY